MTLLEGLLAVLGMTAITVLTRGFFFLSSRELPFPDWLKSGLRFAPLAALMAVVAPEIVLNQGELVTTWRDARLWSAAAGLAWYFWQRGILGTIVAGMAVYLPLRLGLGW
ncbi:MAG: AzlD domain-containing protein [Betaproteobacteria bacterium]|jgi:branched-subunit amino acid transport protein